ncbi:hypothetical protein [Gymnodinialimonas sp.]
MLRALALVMLTLAVVAPAHAQQVTPPEIEAEVEGPMTLPRMASILTAIDENATVEAQGITLTIAGIPVTVVVDPRANRMRVLVPISSSAGLSEEDLMRLMQANFDTALDARYAVAHGRLWSTFIHPLAELQTDQLISGLAQTVTLAQTYGDTYTSGAIMFQGGDTRSLIEGLQQLGEEL